MGLFDSAPDARKDSASLEKPSAGLFDSAPPLTRKRTWGEAATDTAKGLAAGVGSAVQNVGQLAGLVTGQMDNPITRVGESTRQYWDDSVSQPLKEKRARRAQAIEAAPDQLSKFGTAIAETITDPALLVDTAASTAASMVPAMGAGAAAAKLLGAGAGVAAGVGMGSAQAGADAAGGAFERARSASPEVWATNPEYQRRVAAGEDPEAVKDAMALETARVAFVPAAGVSLASQALPGARAIERLAAGAGNVLPKLTRLANVPGAQRLAGAAKAGFGEAGQEAIEEGGGRLAGNLAEQQIIDPNTPTFAGVGEQAGLGAVGGFGIGAPIGALGHPAAPPAGPLTRAAATITGAPTAPAAPAPPAQPAGQAPISPAAPAAAAEPAPAAQIPDAAVQVLSTAAKAGKAIGPQALAKAIGVDEAAATDMLRDFEARGLVSPPNKKGTRRVLLDPATGVLVDAEAAKADQRAAKKQAKQQAPAQAIAATQDAQAGAPMFGPEAEARMAEKRAATLSRLSRPNPAAGPASAAGAVAFDTGAADVAAQAAAQQDQQQAVAAQQKAESEQQRAIQQQDREALRLQKQAQQRQSMALQQQKMDAQTYDEEDVRAVIESMLDQGQRIDALRLGKQMGVKPRVVDNIRRAVFQERSQSRAPQAAGQEVIDAEFTDVTQAGAARALPAPDRRPGQMQAVERADAQARALQAGMPANRTEAIAPQQPAPALDNTPEVLDDDITLPSGDPFTIRGAAELAAKRTPGARVVEVEGGFVARLPREATGKVSSQVATATVQESGTVQPTDGSSAVPSQATVKDSLTVAAEKPKEAIATDVAGEQLDDKWTAFAPETGTLNVPRAQMPQIKSAHRGAMVQFLGARGITSEQAEVPADSLKPTQAEFSAAKVKKAIKRAAEGEDRAILVSADGHVLDGHHQWLAKREAGAPVKVIRLGAPIAQLLEEIKQFPSATTADGAIQAKPEQTQQEPTNAEQTQRPEQAPATGQAAEAAGEEGKALLSDAAGPAATAGATHKDTGEPAEPVTPEVIADAAQSANIAPKVSMKEARTALLKMIDEAIEKAPAAAAKGSAQDPYTRNVGKNIEVWIDRQVDGLDTPTLKIEKTTSGDYAIWRNYQNLGRADTMLGARLLAGRLLLGAEWKPTGGPAGTWTFKEVAHENTVSFKVEGDGTFKVINTKERLRAFRKQVEQNFTDKPRDSFGFEPLPSVRMTADKRAQVLAEAERETEAMDAEDAKKPAAAAQPAAAEAAKPTPKASTPEIDPDGRAAPVEVAATPAIPDGYKPFGERYYANGRDLVQGYARFAQGERVKLATGIQGVVTGTVGLGPVFKRLLVRFDSGIETGVNEQELSAVEAAKQDEARPEEAAAIDVKHGASFTVRRKDAELTFRRGEQIKVAGSYPMKTGEIQGISQAKQQFRLGSVWYDFGFAYKPDYDEFAAARAQIDGILDGVAKNRSQWQERLDDARRIARQHNLLAEYRQRIEEAEAAARKAQDEWVEAERKRREERESDDKQKREEEAARVAAEHAAEQPIRMTMAEWKAIHKDMKGKLPDGTRSVMRDGRLRAVEIVKEAAAEPAPTGIEAFKQVVRKLYDGTLSVEEYRAAYDAVRKGEAETRAALAKLSKDELRQTFGILRDGKKDELVNIAYDSMLRTFALGKSYGPNGYLMTRGGYENYQKQRAEALDALVAEQTAESLAEFAAQIRAQREEESTRRAAVAESVQNPKTLDDFVQLMRIRESEGKDFDQARMSLTPEQRATFDELWAAHSRSKRGAVKDEVRTIRAAGQKVDAKIIATKHTQNGHDLYVVRLSERVPTEDYNALNASARQMGGNYSSYRGNGAVPGFQFRDRATAEAFVKLANGDTQAAQEAVNARRDAFEDDRSQSAAERLREMADRLEERADELLARDRKANTDRRARMAASAEASANADKALAGTMRNIAAAIEAGTAKFLDRVRQKVQVETLASYVAGAKSNELRAKYPYYGDYERHQGEPPTQETADFADFPRYTMYRSDLAALGRQLLNVDGTKQLGQRLMKVADDVSDAFTAWAKEPGNLFRLSTFGMRAGEDVRAAIFPSADAAERAIKRSGLVGKAIAFQEKRGVHRVIMSPSQAIAAGIWKGDGDKRIHLNPEFGAELVEAIGKTARRGAKVAVPWQLETAYDRRKFLSRMGIETPAEFRAALREFIGLRQQPAAADRVKELERSMIGRAKDGLDFFPTPSAVADEMIAAAGIEHGMTVLEPSAGMGHIAERIRESGVEPGVVEFSSARRELLEAKGFNVVGRDFMDLSAPHDPVTIAELEAARDIARGEARSMMDGAIASMNAGDRAGASALAHRAARTTFYTDFHQVLHPLLARMDGGYDRIVMNPPFSDGRDVQHVQHAYSLLKPGGRLVALMGESAFVNQNKRATEFRDWLEAVGGTEEKLPEGSFMDPSLPVNTSANARMVVIDKPEARASFSKSGEAPRFSPATARAWQALADIPGTFQRQRTDAKSFEDIARAILPDAEVIEFEDGATITVPPMKDKDGQVAKDAEGNPGTPKAVTMTILDGQLAMDASQLQEGVHRGSALYSIALAYAHNNGVVFIPDPADVSEAAMQRRGEHMLSSALKYGTTRHMVPHEDQGLDWRPGDDQHNVLELIRASADNVLDNIPETESLDYDWDSGRFIDTAAGGKPVTTADFERIAESGAGRKARAGVSTLRRGVVSRSLERRAGTPAWRGVVTRLLQLGRAGVRGSQLEGILYGRGAASKGTDPARLRALFKGTATRLKDAHGIDLQVLDSADALPQSIRDQDDYDDTVQAVITGDRRTVYLIANRIRSPEAAFKLAAHELVGHFAMEEMLGARLFGELQQRIKALADAGKWPEVFAEVRRRYERNADGTFRALDDATFASEAIAVFAEKNIRTSILQRAINAVRGFLRRIFPQLQLSQGELRQMLWEAGQYLEGRAYRPEVAARALGEQAPKAESLQDTMERYAFGRTSERDTFYSALLRAIEEGKGLPKAAGATQWKQWLDGAQRRGEIKQSERDWIGLDAWLDGQQGNVTREALAEYVRANRVQVQEVVLGDQTSRSALMQKPIAELRDLYAETYGGFADDADVLEMTREELVSQLEPDENADLGMLPTGAAKYASYRTPGGENYRELLLTLPLEKRAAEHMNGPARGSDFDSLARFMQQNGAPADLVERTQGTASELKQIEQETYTSPHWDQPNVLAHVRFDEREAGGKRVLFVQEIQSDWHQAGRKNGYGDGAQRRQAIKQRMAELAEQIDDGLPEDVLEQSAEYERLADELRGTPSGGVPDAPLKQTDEWAMLAFKRMARWAVDNGFDTIAWTTGEQAAEVFDLSKQVDTIAYEKNDDGTFRVEVGKDGANVDVKPSMRAEDLEGYVGKDVAQRIIDGKGEFDADDGMKYLAGENLKVGGAGMRGFYDKILPAAVGKWARKFGASVGKARIQTGKTWETRTAQQAQQDGGWMGRREVPTMGEVHAVDITPAMRAAVAEGQPLFAKGAEPTMLDRLQEAINPNDTTLLQRIKDKAADLRPDMLAALQLRHLGELAEDTLPPMAQYADMVQQMQTLRNELQQASIDIVEKSMAYQKARPEEAARMFRQLLDATLAGVDPSAAHKPLVMLDAAENENEPVTKASVRAFAKKMDELAKLSPGSAAHFVRRKKEALKLWGQEKKRAASHAEMAPVWEKLSPDGKELWAAIRDTYAKQSDQYQDALMESLKASITDGRKQSMLLKQLRLNFESNRVPFYVPLSRWGEYFVAATAPDGTREFHMQETTEQQRLQKQKLKAAGYTKISSGVKSMKSRQLEGASAVFMADVDKVLQESNAPEKVRNDVYQLYLTTLPEMSMRKNFIHRKGTPGFSEDVVRSLASHVFHSSYQIARLKFTHELDKQVLAAQEIADAMAEVDSPEANRAGHLVRELRDRHEWVMNPKDSGWAQKLTTLGFLWYLAVSPAAAAVNMLQTAIVSFPVLAARFGVSKAGGELWRAWKQSFRTLGHMEKLDGAQALTADEKRAHDELQRRGTFDRSQVHNLAGLAESDTHIYNPTMHKALSWSSALFHGAEVINRESTAMATYRMARAAGQSHEAAIAAADKYTNQTHLDYSNSNRSRWMRGNVAKVLLQFKQYSMGMTWLLGRAAWQSLKAADPKTRAENRRALAGILGMTAVFSGTMGLPMMGLVAGVMNAVAAAFGDDDEPWDFETEWRAFWRDLLGEKGAEAVLRGPVQALTGAGIAARTSLGELWFRSPDREMEGQALAHYWLEQAAGPVAGGMFVNALRGYQQIEEGHVWRGFETMMPKFIKDGMKTIRYMDEGVNTMRGDAVVEDLNVGETILQIMGMSPASIGNAYDVQGDVKGYADFIKARKTRLLDAYALAWRLGDTEAQQEVMAKMQAFSAKYPQLAITGDTIRRSFQSRARYSAQAENGVVVDPRIRAMLEQELAMGQ